MNRSNNSKVTIAFLFNEKVSFPPDIHDMKVYYLSTELIRRGIPVKWILIGNRSHDIREDHQIQFISLSTPRIRMVGRIIEVWRVAKFCRRENVRCVYADEWLLYRNEPLQRFVLQLLLRVFRIKFVIDQRDPYLDFEITLGSLKQGSIRHVLLASVYRLSFLLADLIILPSKEYSRLYQEDGIPKEKVMGVFRGIDTLRFNPKVDPSELRRDLGANDKFVIGWYGIMLQYRQISEIIIPISKKVREFVPNALVIVGGQGPEESKIERLMAEEPTVPLKHVGFVPYEKLPQYLSMCDVLLCPVDTRSRFTKSSIWLKIFEGLAVGRPVIATRTPPSTGELKDLMGVIWVEGTLESYLDAIRTVHNNYRHYLQASMQQAKTFSIYDTRFTFSQIANRILERINA